MIKIAFDREKYELLESVDLTDLGKHIQFADEEQSIILDEEKVIRFDFYNVPYAESPIDVLLECITEEVAASGMIPDQENLRSRQKALCNMYDWIREHRDIAAQE